jgi:hypothetical protein
MQRSILNRLKAQMITRKKELQQAVAV